MPHDNRFIGAPPARRRDPSLLLPATRMTRATLASEDFAPGKEDLLLFIRFPPAWRFTLVSAPREKPLPPVAARLSTTV